MQADDIPHGITLSDMDSTGSPFTDAESLNEGQNADHNEEGSAPG